MKTARRMPFFVVVPPRALLLDIAGPVEVLRKANLLQDAVQFDVRFIGPEAEVGSSIGLTISGIAPLPGSLPDGAMVIISGAADEPLGTTANRREDAVFEQNIVTWLAQSIIPGVTLVTICSGALLAARAGLFEGYACTTHHATLDALARAAPTARVQDNRLYVEDRDRLSSAGITAGIDLMLAIVARECGHAVALEVARYLVVYLRRSGADPQISPFLQGRNHIHPVVHRAQDAICAEPASAWTVDGLANCSGTSPRTLSRLFNTHVGMSVSDYINSIRVALARELVTGSSMNMEQVAHRSGFSSTRHFRRAWARHYGSPPAMFRRINGQSEE